ncbi:MAG TPA: biopolymer transporter ExbD, partial [Opitutales bacterium]|nr:biopolymer transporter ExbD [Opitutales bacterium]
ETVTVTVDDKNSLFWDKESVTFDQFLTRIVRFRETCEATSKEPRILFNADTRAGYGSCITILDEIRKAGIEKVSIETRVRKAPSQ